MSGHLRRADGRAKAGYDTAEQAARHANPAGAENVYECRRCGKWHVGHVPGSTFRSLLNRRLRANNRR